MIIKRIFTALLIICVSVIIYFIFILNKSRKSFDTLNKRYVHELALNHAYKKFIDNQLFFNKYINDFEDSTSSYTNHDGLYIYIPLGVCSSCAITLINDINIYVKNKQNVYFVFEKKDVYLEREIKSKNMSNIILDSTIFQKVSFNDDIVILNSELNLLFNYEPTNNDLNQEFFTLSNTAKH